MVTNFSPIFSCDHDTTCRLLVVAFSASANAQLLLCSTQKLFIMSNSHTNRKQQLSTRERSPCASCCALSTRPAPSATPRLPTGSAGGEEGGAESHEPEALSPAAAEPPAMCAAPHKRAVCGRKGSVGQGVGQEAGARPGRCRAQLRALDERAEARHARGNTTRRLDVSSTTVCWPSAQPSRLPWCRCSPWRRR
jgi:hypothetical protein